MKPLTIEQLKSLEIGDWVWLEIKDKQALYVKKCEARTDDGFNFTADFVVAVAMYSDYGIEWQAWKNKEQAEAKGEIMELPCKVGDTVWVINYEWLRYREQKVACIEIHQYDTFLFLTDKTVFSVAGVGIDLFTNKAAAERRLAELIKE